MSVKPKTAASSVKDSKDKNDKKESRSERMTKAVFFAAFVIILIVLSSVLFMRLFNSRPVMPRGDSYHDLQVAAGLASGNLGPENQMQMPSYQAQQEHFSAYHWALAFVMRVISVDIVMLFLPLFGGIIFSMLFFEVQKLIGVSSEKAAFSLLVLAATPAFIILFTAVHAYSFIAVLYLLFLFLLLRFSSRLMTVLNSFVLLAIAFTSIPGFVITIASGFLALFILKKKAQHLKTFFIQAAGVSIILLFAGSFLSVDSALDFHAFDFKDVFSILKAGLGFDIFLLILFFVGFFVMWGKDDKKDLLHLLAAAFVVFSFFNSTARVFASFVLIVYCVEAVFYLYSRKWSLSIIRFGVLLLISCSLIFSGMNEISILASDLPDTDMHEALASLRYLPQGKVLAFEKDGFLVEYYSGMPVMLDEAYGSKADHVLIAQDYSFLLSSARLAQAEPVLDRWQIRYILITPEMRETLWEGKERGLSFLVKNSERFIKKYEKHGIEIWEYVPKAKEQSPL